MRFLSLLALLAFSGCTATAHDKCYTDCFSVSVVFSKTGYIEKCKRHCDEAFKNYHE